MKSLIEKARKGNRKAFVALMDGYKKSIHSIAKSRLFDEDYAIEIFKKTVIDAYENVKYINTNQEFGEYLVKTTIKNCDELAKLHNINNDRSNIYYEYSDDLDFLSMIDFLNNDEKSIIVLNCDDQYNMESIENIFNMKADEVRKTLDSINEKIEKRYASYFS